MKPRQFPLKTILALTALFVAVLFYMQGRSEAPEKVEFVRVAGFKGSSWYEQQARLWEKEIEKDSRNANAWYNYYLANEYSFWEKPEAGKERKEKLSAILSEMEKNLAGTYGYYFLKYRFNHNDADALEQAYRLQPSNPDLYYELILRYELEGNAKKFKEFNRKLYDSHHLASGLVNYNYNMLMSPDSNAILFTNGDNDTYPAWMLQQAKDIRQDIMVVNLHLIRFYRDYLQRKLFEKNIRLEMNSLPDGNSGDFVPTLCRAITDKNPLIPLYFAVTVYQESIGAITDSLFMVGLAYRYSPARFDNVARVKENLENRFRLDYLHHDWYSETHPSTSAIVTALNANYISPMMLLYEDCLKRNDLAAERWKKFAFEIARQTGKEQEMEKYLQIKQPGR